jgi:hypothetical protein
MYGLLVEDVAVAFGADVSGPDTDASAWGQLAQDVGDWATPGAVR